VGNLGISFFPLRADAGVAFCTEACLCKWRGTAFGASLLLPLPTPGVGVPDTVAEQSIQIGKVGIVVDEEAQAFAIFLARPPTCPHLPSRIIRVEVRTAERRPAAMRTTFNVAAVAMAFADGCAAIRAGSNRLTHEYLSLHTSANALTASATAE
jgi:hypothetical protein